MADHQQYKGRTQTTHRHMPETSWQIGSRGGQNQTAVMRICDRCMQEDTTDRPGRSHPPQCSTSREDRQIVQIAQSGLSTRRPLLGLHLTQNERRLLRQWCDERGKWKAGWNEVAFTDDSCICLQNQYARFRLLRHCGVRIMNSR
ncbi:transposable element Tcb1 transposase [Trichonephila clavipes]|nr:transposable element Tcb1 transposase [Trichonephila clavipes]